MASHKHAHAWRVIATGAPDHPYVLVGCTVERCIETERLCVLCHRDGNRRRHGKHIVPRPGVREAIEDAKVELVLGGVAAVGPTTAA